MNNPVAGLGSGAVNLIKSPNALINLSIGRLRTLSDTWSLQKEQATVRHWMRLNFYSAL